MNSSNSLSSLRPLGPCCIRGLCKPAYQQRLQLTKQHRKSFRNLPRYSFMFPDPLPQPSPSLQFFPLILISELHESESHTRPGKAQN